MDVLILGDGGSEFENQGRFKSTGRFEQETGVGSQVTRIGEDF
jgi:hypothetical protein